MQVLGVKRPVWFSNLDLMNGYMQIPLKELARDLTTIISSAGIHRFKVSPYGLHSSGVTFLRLMDQVLGDLLFKSCVVYVDDLLVWGKDFKDMLESLAQVFDRFRRANLTLKPSKCKFFMKSVTFLGHVISGDGVRTSPYNADKVKTYTKPTNKAQLRSFLGLTNYYRRFVKGYCDLVDPLQSLLTKSAQWKWEETHQYTFDTLRDMIARAPVLGFVQFGTEHPLKLYCDASDRAVGFCLAQDQKLPDDPDGKVCERAIQFGGTRLAGAALSYSVTEKEMLALVYACGKLHKYLIASPTFYIFTDHQPLCSILRHKSTNNRLIRWSLALAQYRFVVKYVPGSKMCVADAMSRRDYPEAETIEIPNDPVMALEMPERTVKANSIVPNERNPIAMPKRDVVVPNERNLIAPSERDIAMFDERNPTALLKYDVTEPNERNSTAMSENDNVTVDERNPERNRVVPAVLSVTNAPTTKVSQPNQESNPFEQVSMKQLREAQLTDPEMADKIKYLTKGEEPEDKHARRRCLGDVVDYIVEDDILYHITITGGRTPILDRTYKTLVVPTPFRSLIVWACHAENHLTYAKTYAKLRMKYYWSSMARDIQDLIKTCEHCLKANPVPSHIRPPLMSESIPSGPLQVFHMDILNTSFPSQGYNYVILAVCKFSKMTVLGALKSQTAQAVAKFVLEKIIFRFGCPYVIETSDRFSQTMVTDQGRQFTSRIYTSLCEMLNIKCITTSIFNPQANSSAERMCQVVMRLLNRFVSSNPKAWYPKLAQVEFVINSTVQQSTDYTPFHLMHGIEVREPHDLVLEQPDPVVELPHNEARQQWMVQLAQIRQIAKENMEVAQKEQKHYYDQRSVTPHFDVGDIVYVKANYIDLATEGRKLRVKYEGPYTITEFVTPVNVRLRNNQTNRHMKMTYHLNKLKLAKDRDVVEWEIAHRGAPVEETPSTDDKVNKQGTPIATQQPQGDDITQPAIPQATDENANEQVRLKSPVPIIPPVRHGDMEERTPPVTTAPYRLTPGAMDAVLPTVESADQSSTENIGQNESESITSDSEEETPPHDIISDDENIQDTIREHSNIKTETPSSDESAPEVDTQDPATPPDTQAANQNDESVESDQYQISKIHYAKANEDGTRSYLVSWKDYPKSYNSYVNYDDLNEQAKTYVDTHKIKGDIDK